MSLYYSYNDFMRAVIEKADSLTRERDSCPLWAYFDVSMKSVRIIQKMLQKEWTLAEAVFAFLAAPVILWNIAVGNFLSTAIGVVFKALFGTEAKSVLTLLRNDSSLTDAVRRVGKEFRPRWNDAEGDQSAVDALLDKAAERLYQLGRGY